MDHDGDPAAEAGFSRQRKQTSDPLCCPICGVTLRSSEIDQHFALEVDRLDKILKPKQNLTGQCFGGGPSSSAAAVPGTSSGSSNGHAENGESSTVVNPDECWGTYQKIKNNRQARLKMKSRKRKTEDNICPICNKTVLEELTVHVDACLRKSETNGSNGGTTSRGTDSDDDDASIDVEGGENFEVYEWAGQTRVRTTSSLHQSGSFASTTVRVTNADDTDDELNVDGDETQIYGPPQYSERDIIYPIADNRYKDSYLRGLVMANEPATLQRRSDNSAAGEGSSRAHQSLQQQQQPTPPRAENGQHADQIIESLKSKVREYEGFIQNRPKCLICMDDFRKPVVSICCWHVYCEECWLHTLGAKKLCPQCSMITSPTDLRRIYL
ncbi:E3 ubiquitin-protein ligase RNF220 [Culex quinquefasciatus]|uniref:E3 ubiquitin-protein ligase RNF220 n=1 Tax=Culex quinquefasciatus TaxID=7176 RepID=UPI0018E37BA4|nr:E3 ubiquitin-protein ligase RNF220 [Culex quinquefasciatus]